MTTKKQILELYIESGVDCFLSSQPVDRFQELTSAISIPEKEKSNEGVMSQSRGIADRCTTLKELEASIRAFDGCEIKQQAQKTVFADGDPKASIMLIGEAPGASEDQQGIPFCGPSGKLLDNILYSIKLTRESVYITNTVFWRPPGNRRPTSLEIETCRPFVEKHVALVGPKLIILVGNTAVESLLKLQLPMHSIRHQEFQYSNRYMQSPIPASVIFHPSYLLRSPFKKKDMWYDILKIQKKLKV
ncbi:uracil-DNA glycosylase [Rickettsiales endosymbiont of Peranema trichophorum]|uniref:uracil-DNA glycosylase n=1 Tax=Rickettsiales endosymbiont of Peranema trichophorum TaxID=2486577 RepID=UPI001023943E|nr:uracil-DNA glycosylase [Rickettsiales endosymbiont of Peranema trichophorum]RZI47587.1 uracil-DNA glycosylase [Rickettsiales endosymbiont of Peranema trichophorum]